METTNINVNEIFPGFRAMVFDPYANGKEGYLQNEGEYKAASIVKRYGFVSEWMEKEHGRETARYPDCVDVIFDHSGRLSKAHFTDGIRALN